MTLREFVYRNYSIANNRAVCAQSIPESCPHTEVAKFGLCLYRDQNPNLCSSIPGNPSCSKRSCRRCRADGYKIAPTLDSKTTNWLFFFLKILLVYGLNNQDTACWYVNFGGVGGWIFFYVKRALIAVVSVSKAMTSHFWPQKHTVYLFFQWWHV